VDPLGFGRGYLFLAERILPGLTNAANKPRYLSVLCAAVLISDQASPKEVFETPQAEYARREASIMRMERFWALACVLASQADEGFEISGVRGLLDAQRAVRKIAEKGQTETNGDFRLLARQTQYGLIGIYANVAERLMLIDRKTLRLSSTPGADLAQAFLIETDVPKALRMAVAEGGEVKVKTLKAWGKRAHISGAFGSTEGQWLRAALYDDAPTRMRMAELLRKTPLLEVEAGETELARLARIEASIEQNDDERDLYEALRALRFFEACFQECMLVFYRMLWFAKEKSPALSLNEIGADPVVAESYKVFCVHSRALSAAFDGASLARQPASKRLAEPVRWLKRLAEGGSSLEFAQGILNRHRDVQQSKRDGGRPKMPWIEEREGRISRTIAVSQGIEFEPSTAVQMAPHIYRTVTVDNFHIGSTA
jgi:hypothetical protein